MQAVQHIDDSYERRVAIAIGFMREPENERIITLWCDKMEKHFERYCRTMGYDNHLTPWVYTEQERSAFTKLCNIQIPGYHLGHVLIKMSIGMYLANNIVNKKELGGLQWIPKQQTIERNFWVLLYGQLNYDDQAYELKKALRRSMRACFPHNKASLREDDNERILFSSIHNKLSTTLFHNLVKGIKTWAKDEKDTLACFFKRQKQGLANQENVPYLDLLSRTAAHIISEVQPSNSSSPQHMQSGGGGSEYDGAGGGSSAGLPAAGPAGGAGGPTASAPAAASQVSGQASLWSSAPGLSDGSRKKGDKRGREKDYAAAESLLGLCQLERLPAASPTDNNSNSKRQRKW